MNCASCGQALKPNARFCNSCGASVPAAAAPAPATGGGEQTLIASSSSMPIANVDKTIALPQNQVPPPAQPANPAPQPGYGPPPQQQTNPMPQAAYAPPQQSGFNQPGQAGQGYPQYAAPYATTPARTVPPTAGRIPAGIMLASALAMVVSIFLPFLFFQGDSISVFQVLRLGSELNLGNEEGFGLYASFAGAAVAGLLFSALAFALRRNVWAVFTLLVGLYMAGLNALLLIGASTNDSGPGAGIAVILFTVAGLAMLIGSIAFMVTKKR